MTREEILKMAKPVLFNTEMVRAILEGRKTVTRRLVKPQPDEKHNFPLGFVIDSTNKKDIGKFGFGINEFGGSHQYAKPPCKKGDYLYVRETWQYLYELDGNEQIIEGTDRYYYKATDTIPFDTYVDSMGITHTTVPWKPSIHMPKEAARIFLKVTDVRVERLQDITEEQVLAEGIYPSNCRKCTGKMGCDLCPDEGYYEIDAFQYLWNSTIKTADLDKYGWEASPWVWVIEFERVEV